MSRRRKIVVTCVGLLLATIGYSLFGLYDTWRHIPEAYAAWDTGSLLVIYMRSHDDGWPADWEDLLSVLEGKDSPAIMLRGRGSADADLEYARSLRHRVAIDWSFDPDNASRDAQPVTRPGGGRFPVVWSHGEPNELVHHYLQSRAESEPGAEQ